MPPVPYDNKSTAEHRERYPRALEKLFHTEDIARGGQRPGQCPENVFDWWDGLRLIISREWSDEKKEVLHLSASLRPDGKLFRKARQVGRADGPARGVDHFLVQAFARFLELAPGQAMFFAGLTDNVAHWWAPRSADTPPADE